MSKFTQASFNFWANFSAWTIICSTQVLLYMPSRFALYAIRNSVWVLVPRLRCQTESRYVQTVPDGKCLCPDYRAFKIAYVQTIVRSKLHMSRLSCVQNCICPDYRAFIFFPDRVILNAWRHLVRSFRSGHIDFRSGTSTWVVFYLRSKS